MENKEQITTRKGIIALSPIAVFLVLYLVVSIAINDFYKMPLALAFIVASLWGVMSIRRVPLSQRIEIFSRGAANSNVLYMIWIFILAGAFSALAKGVGSIEATVALTMSVLPSQFIIPSMFIAACFISLSIGTSVGTVVALTPFAVELAETTGNSIPFFVAVVLCGSFFGDNLSFISDTTIAATRSQNCKMNEKFKANLWIAVPAAVIALITFSIVGNVGSSSIHVEAANPWLIVPYLLVIVTAIFGMNVLLVLTIGIVSCLIIALLCTDVNLIDMCSHMGGGIDGMGNLIIVTLLASGLLEVIRYNGGIQYLIRVLPRRINGVRGECGERMHRQQHHSHHHRGANCSTHSATVRLESSQCGKSARHLFLHCAVHHPLRRAVAPRCRNCRRHACGFLHSSLLSLGFGSYGGSFYNFPLSALP